MSQIEVGMVAEASEKVTRELSAAHIGSGDVGVYATPIMVRLVERTCHNMVDGFLPEGHVTVGILINLRHLAPTPIGDTVRIRAELIDIQGKRLSFQAKIWDSDELVGEAEHKRAVIEVERFLERVSQKKNDDL
ncbi:MAG: thioesterase family protein [Anaerolineales bacterium]|nr:thioesterase family protein [Anaerolineales bacterium]